MSLIKAAREYAVHLNKVAGSHGDVGGTKGKTPDFSVEWKQDGIAIYLYAPEVLWADDIAQADEYLDGVLKRVKAAKAELKKLKRPTKK